MTTCGLVAVASSGLIPQPLWISARTMCEQQQGYIAAQPLSTCLYLYSWMRANRYDVAVAERGSDRAGSLQ